MNTITLSIARIMNFLSGVYLIAKESILHPFESSSILSTPTGNVVLRPGANLSGITIENYDLRGMNLKNANLQNTVFIDCDLSGVDLTGAKYIGTVKFQSTPTKDIIGIPDSIKAQTSST